MSHHFRDISICMFIGSYMMTLICFECDKTLYWIQTLLLIILEWLIAYIVDFGNRQIENS